MVTRKAVETNLDRRLEFLELKKEDYVLLRPLADWLEARGPEVLAPFFDHLLLFPELAGLFPDEATRERTQASLHRAVTESLRDPARGPEFERARIRIGRTHDRLGVELGWHVGAFCFLEGLLAPELRRQYADAPEEVGAALGALRKVLNLDIQLSAVAYLHHHIERERRAEESSRIKALFLQLVSREIGVPFSFLRKKVEETTQEADPWKSQERLEEIAQAVYRMDGLVQVLVDTAAIEAGTVELQEGPFDLASLISDRISKRIGHLRRFRIQPELPRSLTLQGDKKRFTLLVDDLLDAAINLTPEGGIILVRLEREDRNLAISTHNRTARIQASQLGSLLEWLREELDELEDLEGSTIGLYRAHRSAELLGGRMNLAVPPTGGAMFTVRVPFKKEEDSIAE